ncbi:potassium voltage-gated channel subfamily A member 7-like [Branchiostoma lanceolatum]|uniref:potassium voltage-gated channel subfamily A member 7-like n=1 Tax=Branchiostoma lanceolatum TaxID=7740 RepID=UPI003454F1FD
MAACTGGGTDAQLSRPPSYEQAVRPKVRATKADVSKKVYEESIEAAKKGEETVPWQRKASPKKNVQGQVQSKGNVKNGGNTKSRENNVIRMNVSGMHFFTYANILSKYPATLLGNVSRRKKFYCKDFDEYFFDRHRPSFEGILFYYQTGIMKRPRNVPVEIFVMELKFFDMGDNVIKDLLKNEGCYVPEEELEPQTRIKRIIWDLFEQPETSVCARIVAVLSFLFILISVAETCVETLPQFRTTDAELLNISDMLTNSTEPPTNITGRSLDETISQLQAAFQNPFFCVETACVVWFTLELGMRFYACPSKVAFAKKLLNIIDFAAILPFFVTIVLIVVATSRERAALSLVVLRILRLVRVLRILKLSRHVKAMRLLAVTVYESRHALGSLLLFLMIGVVTFATGIYVTEEYVPNTFFSSIPESFWWAIITMTTVGYGDTYPQGGAGKLVAVFSFFFGILIMAMLMPIFVDKFNEMYVYEMNNPYRAINDLKPEPEGPDENVEEIEQRETSL